MPRQRGGRTGFTFPTLAISIDIGCAYAVPVPCLMRCACAVLNAVFLCRAYWGAPVPCSLGCACAVLTGVRLCRAFPTRTTHPVLPWSFLLLFQTLSFTPNSNPISEAQASHTRSVNVTCGTAPYVCKHGADFDNFGGACLRS